MRHLIAFAAFALIAAPAAAIDGPPPPMPAWMAGAWEQQDGAEWSDEYWTPPRGGVMIGAARSGKGDATPFFEHTRIMRNADGSLSYFAQPRGAPASEFPLFANGPDMIEFVNAEHDYPQRIRYWREGRLLKARIAKLDGTDAVEWTFRPIGSP